MNSLINKYHAMNQRTNIVQRLLDARSEFIACHNKLPVYAILGTEETLELDHHSSRLIATLTPHQRTVHHYYVAGMVVYPTTRRSHLSVHAKSQETQ